MITATIVVQVCPFDTHSMFKVLMKVSHQLLRCRSEDIFSYKTNQMIHRAIRMTIETGALTAAVAITDLVLYLNADANAWYFMLFVLHLPHLLLSQSAYLVACLSAKSIRIHCWLVLIHARQYFR